MRMRTGRNTRLACAALALCLFSAGAASAVYYPSIQITGGPSTNICTSAAFTLPINANTSTSTSNSSTVFVQGVGVVASFMQTNPTFNGTTVYTFAPSAYTVPAGTPITVNVRTFNGVNLTGGQSWDSTVVFACDTGTVISLVNAGLPVPTLSEWTLMLLALLVGVGGAVGFARRRAT